MPFTSALSIARAGAACAALTLAAGCAAPVPEAPLIRPKLLTNSCPMPVYPLQSLRNRETGTTTLTMLVGEDGLVHDVRIQKSSGYESLDRGAMVLRKCRFTPATRGGKPVEFWEPMKFVWTQE